MYCEDAEFRGLLPQFKIMILSIKHETLRSTLWLLFTNPANYCLLTAKHPLPRPTLQYTGLTLPSLHHISDCSHITRRFRDEINTELSKNGFFEGQKQASLAGWFQSRKSYLYCIVNKVVGSQPKVWKGGTRQIKVDIIYRKLFKDGLTSILPHSAFRMGISQVCKVFSFACWSFAAFKAHLRRFRACFLLFL